MTFKKVLILSASAGAGHMRAADAVERAFRLMDAATEVRHVDTLQYTNKLFRHLYSKAYIDLVNKSPELLGWFYDHLDKPWKNERRRLALDKLNTRPFVKMLSAADILLGKPGGLTTHLLENGVAIRCNNLPVLAYRLDRLLDYPTRFASTQAGARRMARPDAARDIVKKLLELKQGQ